MRTADSWDKTFMALALTLADYRSKDPRRQVGCVIVNEAKDPIAFGYNGFAAGVTETRDAWAAPDKNLHVIHAEVNAIGRAARRGCATEGCIAYVTAFPCLPCAKALVAAGIVCVDITVLPRDTGDDNSAAIEFFRRAGVELNVAIDGGGVGVARHRHSP